jgi:ADP-ribosylglycohydrolase
MAIGDAFGAGEEFQDRHWMRENVDFTRFVNARGAIRVPADRIAAFTKDYRPWDYTDDTEMTVALMRAMAAPEPLTEDVIVRELLREYARGVHEKGHGRNGHGSLRWYFEGEKTIGEVRDFQRNRFNPGNAPAVRAVPIGLLPPPSINGYGSLNALATHPNPVAVHASQCIAWACEFMVVQRGDPGQVIAYCQAQAGSGTGDDGYLARVDRLPAYSLLDEEGFRILCGPQPIVEPYFLPGISGVPSDARLTVGSVLYLLKHSEDAFDALKQSILLGGDVDSVAAAATGIMAGRCGLDSLPAFMLENVEGLAYLQEVADLLYRRLNGPSGPL